MMKSKRNDIKRLKNVKDALVNAIIESSDQKFVNDYCNNEETPKLIANIIRDKLNSYKNEKNLRRLKNARKNYEKISDSKKFLLPIDPILKLNILKKFYSTFGRFDNELALMAYRDYDPNCMSEDDVSSLLEDLLELGYITEDMLKNE